MQKLYKILTWAVILFFIILGLVSLTYSIISSIIILLAAAIVAPQTRKLIKNKFQINLSGRITAAIAVVLFLTYVYGVPETAPKNIGATVANKPVEKHSPTKNEDIINQETTINYQIIADDHLADIKRSVDIRLDKKISSNDLRKIANKIYKSSSISYQRTFINYYLPYMNRGNGAWASTNFTPNLKVKILGLTADEEQKMVQAASKDSRDVVGIWLDDRPLAGEIIKIYKKDNKFFLESSFKDGSLSSKEMAASKLGGMTKLEDAGGNSLGEYFILSNDGTLKAAGDNGVFLVYKKIK